jgi:hypothetical protein
MVSWLFAVVADVPEEDALLLTGVVDEGGDTVPIDFPLDPDIEAL